MEEEGIPPPEWVPALPGTGPGASYTLLLCNDAVWWGYSSQISKLKGPCATKYPLIANNRNILANGGTKGDSMAGRSSVTD